jgi:pyruvate dehydrogenase E1 component alpha subunit
MVAGGSISNRASSYGIEGHVVDGNDVISVYKATQEAIRKARQGQGPSLLEMQTYRFMVHSLPGRDKDQYRPREEVENWKRRCPIKILGEKLIADGILTQDKCRVMHKGAEKEIEQAINYAKQAIYAPAEEALEDVYAP